MGLNGWMLIDCLRADLTAANFTVEGLDALWGADAAAALHRGHRLPAIRALGDGALDTLARLFVLGLPTAHPETGLPTLGLAGAIELGLLAADGSPLLDLRPYAFTDAAGAGQWWIASDLGELALGHAIPESHVLGVGGASLTLSGLMTPTPAATALDLGTGCGIQALHASRHAAHIVATDISERALELTRFNAELNDIRSVETRFGSLFDPVAGQRFDHIVSNPPFVITPRTPDVPAYEYRDGGLIGDAIVESVIVGAEDHLTPGGIAQLLGNWEYRADADGLDRVLAWIERTGLDAWVIEREVQDAALYAETWIRDGGTKPGTPEFDALYAAWLDDFAERGVTAVGFGYVTLRRPLYPGIPRLRRLERIETPLGSGLGASIALSLGAGEWLALRSDAELARERLVVAPDLTEERHYWPGDEHPAVITLRQGGGFARQEHAGTALAAVVGACDGELSLGQICGAVAQLLDVDGDTLAAEVVPSIRELVFLGMLEVA
jgi:Methyltransferase small domain